MAMDRFAIETDERLSSFDVTDRVTDVLPSDADGTATIFVQHTTCGLTVNETESRLLGDLESFLANLVEDGGWAHDEIDNNADAHLRAMLLGPDVSVPVSDGALDLGTWQSILLVECDGPRRRTVSVTTCP